MIDRPLLAKRLQEAYDLLRDKGVVHTISEFASALGKTHSAISNALVARGRVMTIGLLQRVADVYSDYLNKDYLLTGQGNIEAIDKSLKPHYPATVSAGVLSGDITNVKESDVEYEPIIKRMPQYDYTIDVSGHSMEPTYSDNGIVACRKLYNKEDIKPGRAYVIATKEGAVLKRIVSQTLSTIRVVSDNPDPKYKPYSIDKDLILSIDEVVGSVNIGNSDRSYKNYITDIMVKSLCKRINEGIKNHEKLEEELESIIRNLATGVYSDNK